MRVKQIEVYTFDELSENVKAKVLNKYSDINVQDDWFNIDGILDVEQTEWIEKWGLQGCLFEYDTILFNIGPDKPYIEFIGLKQTDTYVFHNALQIPIDLWNKVRCYYTVDGKPHCYNTIIEFEEFEPLTRKEREILANAQTIFNSWSLKALFQLKQNYEYLTSDEAIIETIMANGYEFDIYGYRT